MSDSAMISGIFEEKFIFLSLFLEEHNGKFGVHEDYLTKIFSPHQKQIPFIMLSYSRFDLNASRKPPFRRRERRNGQKA